MTYKATVIADSISQDGVRITTMQITYPRYIHAEFMTHRVFSRNASSSRAIPTTKLVDNSLRDMVYPITWGKNQAGMQASLEELSFTDKMTAETIWRDMAEYCATGVKMLAGLGVHKQWANRPLEWFGTITVVVTATDWENFFELRNHEMAQPEIQCLAEHMLYAMDSSIPEDLAYSDFMDAWHLPYISDMEKRSVDVETLLKVSTARCARVSYLTHEGKEPNITKDIELYNQLVGSVPLHASPCEHQATPGKLKDKYSGNFRGWVQHRKLLELKFK